VAEEVGKIALRPSPSARPPGIRAGYGAVPLEDVPLTLILPLATIAAALR
jgi:hypothetical protein